MITAVQESFDELPWETLDNAFLTLQQCMELSIESKGDNVYQLPHMGKQKLRNSGNLPRHITITDQETLNIKTSIYSQRK